MELTQKRVVKSLILREVEQTAARRIIRRLNDLGIDQEEFTLLAREMEMMVGSVIVNEIENEFRDLERGLWTL